jgi:hypothetical protein
MLGRMKGNIEMKNRRTVSLRLKDNIELENYKSCILKSSNPVMEINRGFMVV